MQYIEYQEYLDIGGVCDATAFARNIDRACLMIDRRTQGRIRNFEQIPYEVKCLCRDLVEYISEYSVNKTIVNKSQSVGAISESESYAVKSAEEFANDLDRLFEEYLTEVKTKNGISVLYRGAQS